MMPMTVAPTSVQFQGQRRVILVHGYNSDRDGCDVSYEAFFRQLRKCAPRMIGSVLTLSWPGSTALDFDKAVLRAKGDVAAVLAKFLRRSTQRWDGELVFIGHSLGCRLIAEALRRIAPPYRDHLLARTKIYLLAAAIPTPTVLPNGTLRSIVEACNLSHVFYSQSDEVLLFAFPVGSLKEQRRLVEAVGLHGDPEDLWTARRHMVDYRHSSYWGSKEVVYDIAESLRANRIRRQPKRNTSSRATDARKADTRKQSARAMNRRRH
jgi:hypothetical protein